MSFGPLDPTVPEFRYFWFFQWHKPINLLLFFFDYGICNSKFFLYLQLQVPNDTLYSSSHLCFSVFVTKFVACLCHHVLEKACSLLSNSSQPSVQMDKGLWTILVESLNREDPNAWRSYHLTQHPSPPGLPWTSYSASLCLCFLIYKIRIIIVLILWDCCKD